MLLTTDALKRASCGKKKGKDKEDIYHEFKNSQKKTFKEISQK